MFILLMRIKTSRLNIALVADLVNKIGECTYIAGIAYDSFNVWIHKGKQPDGSFLESCVAEDVKSFDEAFSIAQSHK
jgi:hypothetical protein